jgi:hypothetical protein
MEAIVAVEERRRTRISQRAPEQLPPGETYVREYSRNSSLTSR